MQGDLLDLLGRLRAILDRCRWPCAVIGGAALAVRARVRTTRDIDVVLAIPPGELESLLKAAQENGFRYDAADRDTLMAEGLIRLWVAAPSSSGDPKSVPGIDFLTANDEFTAEVIRRAEPVDFGAVRLPVATPEDLILMKLDANRPHDLDDAIALKDAHLGKLDRVYLNTWASKLGITARLEALLGAP